MARDPGGHRDTRGVDRNVGNRLAVSPQSVRLVAHSGLVLVRGLHLLSAACPFDCLAPAGRGRSPWALGASGRAPLLSLSAGSCRRFARARSPFRATLHDDSLAVEDPTGGGADLRRSVPVLWRRES